MNKVYQYQICPSLKYTILETLESKQCKGPDYNYIFNKSNGFFARWGKTKEDNPKFSPIGPEILDIEISTGGCSQKCKYCYKDNTSNFPTNMNLETFKKILDKMPKCLTQIALGITDLKTNPDLFNIMSYTRESGIIPNLTLSGIDLDDDLATKLNQYAGAIAVSVSQTDKNICYDTVELLTNKGMEQINIHIVVAAETQQFVYEVLEDSKKDQRLRNLNCIVFLGLKPKGRAKDNGFRVLSNSSFERLLDRALSQDLSIGFDSCSAPKFDEFVRNSRIENEHKKLYLAMSESCESFGIFSSYINVHGDFFPCSFAEGECEWKEGISVLNCDDFLKDVWYSDKLSKYRKIALETEIDGCRPCLIFKDINLDNMNKRIEEFDIPMN